MCWHTQTDQRSGVRSAIHRCQVPLAACSQGETTENLPVDLRRQLPAIGSRNHRRQSHTRTHGPTPDTCAYYVLTPQVHEVRVEEVMNALCSKVITGLEEQRDICSIGMFSPPLREVHEGRSTAVC